MNIQWHRFWVVVGVGCALIGAVKAWAWTPEQDACLKVELAPCGKMLLPSEGPYNEEQQKVFACRVHAMAKCLDGSE
jgi:hypothetical protein